MSTQGSFLPCRALLEQGEPDEVLQACEEYAHRLVALAHAHLSQALHRKEGAEAVVQSVFRSFFRRCQGREYEFGTPENLWGLLVQITLKRCRGEIDQPGGQNGDPAWLESALAASDPTQEEAAHLADLVCQLMSRLGTEAERRVVELSLRGFVPPEISLQLGYPERGVVRIRTEIRGRLEELMRRS